MSTESDLTEALSARHALVTGKLRVSFSVTTGGGSRTLTFSQTTMKQLDTYIAGLRREISGVTKTRNRISYAVPD